MKELIICALVLFTLSAHTPETDIDAVYSIRELNTSLDKLNYEILHRNTDTVSVSSLQVKKGSQ